MKKILFTIIAICCSWAAQAQNEVVTATLQTGDEVKVYNGPTALTKAVAAAAESGSVITLSNGTFDNPGAIQKSLCIYGNGWEENTEEGIKPSVISGDLNFSTGSDEVILQDVKIEGVKTGTISATQTSGLIISKCQFGNFSVGANTQGISIRQCYFGTVVGSAYTTLDVQNSISTGRMTYNNEEALLLFDHCILSYYAKGYFDYLYHYKATYTNCVIRQNPSWGGNFQAGSTLKNNILICTDLSGCIAENNWLGTDMSTIFADGTNFDYAPTRTFALLSPETYVGTDGTEVGIYGGNYPWDKTPTTPVVKNLQLEVSGKTLNVTYDAQVR